MTDGYGREISYLRISVTELCNLRCRYCMGEDGVHKKCHQDMLTEEETVQAIRAAASLGIKKLRFTGGEPLVKRNIVKLCTKAAKTDGIEEVCLTTNGVTLRELAKPLREAGVKRINLSLDTLDAEKYAYITRNGNIRDFYAGFNSALEQGFDRIKLNAVLIGGFNDDEIPALAELTRKYPVDMRFIEMMPIGPAADFDSGSFIPCTTVLDSLPELKSVAQDGGVARLYRLPEAQGNIGLISPISSHFCGDCNRIRLTADGKIKPCLHSNAEYPIKGLDYEGMVEQFKMAIMAKPSWHGELDRLNPSHAGRRMNQIGG